METKNRPICKGPAEKLTSNAENHRHITSGGGRAPRECVDENANNMLSLTVPPQRRGGRGEDVSPRKRHNTWPPWHLSPLILRHYDGFIDGHFHLVVLIAPTIPDPPLEYPLLTYILRSEPRSLTTGWHLSVFERPFLYSMLTQPIPANNLSLIHI